VFAGKTPKGVKKKPRRRHKKGKGSPSGLGPNKKGSGNSSVAAARTEVTQSMHLADYTSIPVVAFSSSENEFVSEPQDKSYFELSCLL
jgi:hypothetical protein